MIVLIPLSDIYSVYQLTDKQEIPEEILSSGFCSVTKTEDEVSIVTNCGANFDFLQSPKKWKGFKVEGILDFSLVGIINDITTPLKENGISVFVVSTYNTDYVFVTEDNFEKATAIFGTIDTICI
jgi:hypothetical protein